MPMASAPPAAPFIATCNASTALLCVLRWPEARGGLLGGATSRHLSAAVNAPPAPSSSSSAAASSGEPGLRPLITLDRYDGS